MFKILFSPKRARNHPLEIMLIGFIYATISIFFAAWIFPEYSSIAMVFLTVFFCLFLLQKSIDIEEKSEKTLTSEKKILKGHARMIKFVLFLFLGFLIAFSIWSFVLPTQKVAHIFEFQDSAVKGVRSSIATGAFDAKSQTFLAIFFNNLKVLLISLIFAIFYGAGAIYVLVWNASVMGFVIGELARNSFGLASLPLAFAKFLPHGLTEMLAYLIIALAGGIIYSAALRGDFKNNKRRKRIILDVSMLILISITILFLAGIIEVYLSPFI